MDKYCAKCGAELVDGACPNCTAAPVEPEVAEKTIKITQEVPSGNPVAEPAEPEQAAEPVEAAAEAGQTAKLDEEPAPVRNEPPETEEQSIEPPEQIEQTQQLPHLEEQQPVQPSKFYYVFRQVGNVLKHFFSKHTVDAISAQYAENLPIWVILMPACALISALSMTLSFDGTRGLSIGAGSLFSGMKLSGLEVFLISFAMSLAVEFVYSLAVMIFLKSFKVKAKFKAAANLTMSAYIAVAVLDTVNISTIGYLDSESTALSGFGMIAFILLLYFGITRVLYDKKPFWSFFLMMTCASVVALIVALVICCPIIVMRGLEELANTTITF